MTPNQPEVKKSKKMKFQAPRGMNDILPEESKFWEYLRSVVKATVEPYRYGRFESPLVECKDVFIKGMGQATDVVEKEMYSLSKKGGEDLVLRPEYTAGIARAYIEHGMSSWPQPVKLYSMGPIFRYNRPQEGRFRQFSQINIEVIGNSRAIIDAEVIHLGWKILERAKLNGVSVHINSIGCPDCRPEYRQILKDYYKSHKNKLCADCKRRYQKNPLRLLDCKEEKCRRFAANAPQSIDHLCESCKKHFKQVLEALDELNIPYSLDATLVRGLDYYTKTVFEFFSEEKGGSMSLGGGGRYDGLIELMGGLSTPAVGMALGFERIMWLMKEQKVQIPEKEKPNIFLAQLGDLAKKKALKIFDDLYKEGIEVVESFGRDSIKSQLKMADKMRAKITLILGQKEAVEETILVRDMESGVQEVIPQERLVRELKKRLGIELNKQ